MPYVFDEIIQDAQVIFTVDKTAARRIFDMVKRCRSKNSLLTKRMFICKRKYHKNTTQ